MKRDIDKILNHFYDTPIEPCIKLATETKRKIELKLFDRHHVRGNFYHLVALTFMVATGLWMFDIISDTTNMYVSGGLFVIDYLAEMYDPHPDTPGKWFESHFHRFFDKD